MSMTETSIALDGLEDHSRVMDGAGGGILSMVSVFGLFLAMFCFLVGSIVFSFDGVVRAPGQSLHDGQCDAPCVGAAATEGNS